MAGFFSTTTTSFITTFQSKLPRPSHPLLDFVGFPLRHIPCYVEKAIVEPLRLGGQWIRRRPRLPTEAQDGQNDPLEVRPSDGMFTSGCLSFTNEFTSGTTISFMPMGFLFYTLIVLAATLSEHPFYFHSFLPTQYRLTTCPV